VYVLRAGIKEGGKEEAQMKGEAPDRNKIRARRNHEVTVLYMGHSTLFETKQRMMTLVVEAFHPTLPKTYCLSSVCDCPNT
jgi:hypothetical protein